MYELHVYRQNEKVLSLKLEKNLFLLGRGPKADIQFEDPSLSRPHCVLVKKDQKWFVEDQSKNGILGPGGEPIQGRERLEVGSRYCVGRLYSFELSEPESNDDLKTIVLSRSPTKVMSADLKSKKLKLGRAVLKGKLADGAPFEKKVGPEGLSLGSHTMNDLIYPSEHLSRFHARIDLIQNDFVLTDLSSLNGTQINGVSILKARLNENTQIFIGPYEFQFEIIEEDLELTPHQGERLGDLVSKNEKMKSVFSLVEALGPTLAPVFIHGETGTGKELVAHALHSLSTQEADRFVAINCAALPKDLVESELFGHEKGAFTGAHEMRRGAFELAHRGTLFLDEVADLDLSIQAKLLRALESQEIRRVGSTQAIPISIRFIAASHKNLAEEVAAGRFREDLYYRLHVVPIELPPLRERMDDLELLCTELLKRLRLQLEFDASAYASLRRHSFPGNIRELRNILQRIAVELDMKAIRDNSRARKRVSSADVAFVHLKSEFAMLTRAQLMERRKIEAALVKYDGIQIKAAQSLKMPLSTLNDKIRKYGLARK